MHNFGLVNPFEWIPQLIGKPNFSSFLRQKLFRVLFKQISCSTACNVLCVYISVSFFLSLCLGAQRTVTVIFDCWRKHILWEKVMFYECRNFHDNFHSVFRDFSSPDNLKNSQVSAKTCSH